MDIRALKQVKQYGRQDDLAAQEELLRIQSGQSEEGTLYITDLAGLAAALVKEGCPVLGILTEENRSDSFGGVRYLTEESADFDADYLENIYRRYKGLPWTILTTDRCIVRETTEADVDAFYRIYAEETITRYMEPLFEDKEEALVYTAQYRENVYEFYGFGIWTVVLKETGEIIGRAGLTMREGYEDAELGFVIGVPWQGRGLAKEVCEAILQYGWRELEFTQIQALAEPENAASIALLEKLGFQMESECAGKNKNYLKFLKKSI